MRQLPIPYSAVRSLYMAYDPQATENDAKKYFETVEDAYNYCINVHGMEEGIALTTVYNQYFDELKAAITERAEYEERKKHWRKATQEEVEAMSMEEALMGAGCESEEEFQYRFGDWL